jgi:hypothetical protein
MEYHSFSTISVCLQIERVHWSFTPFQLYNWFLVEWDNWVIFLYEASCDKFPKKFMYETEIDSYEVEEIEEIWNWSFCEHYQWSLQGKKKSSKCDTNG